MGLTKKVLDFWEDTTASIEYYVNKVIKKKLKEKGKSEANYMFYDVKISGSFPIEVKANISCHCHPEWKTVMTISKEDIVNEIKG